MKAVYLIGKDSIPEHIVLQAGESLDMTLLALPDVSCDLALRIDLMGEGATADLRGLYLCHDSEKLRISVDLRHISGGCTSHQNFRGIVGGNAVSEFYGLIYVKQDAQNTKAYQENHNILLSEHARVETKPQLEIYADDVECSHGATIGRLNEDEQFYMRSRGIPEDEARVLQMISFISPIVDHLEDAELREKVYESLSEC